MVKVTDHVKAKQIVTKQMFKSSFKAKSNCHQKSKSTLETSLLQCNRLNVGCHCLVNLVRSMNVCMIKIIASNLVGRQVRL